MYALFDGFAAVARALGNGRRAEIIDVLAQGGRHVEEIASEIDQPVANTSFHLRSLAAVGLVATRRDGTRIYYRLASDQVGQLWSALRQVAVAHQPPSTGSPRPISVTATSSPRSTATSWLAASTTAT
jgi:DNA-binding transcriptional ArsR family regulator